jgi:hypothetical protein
MSKSKKKSQRPHPLIHNRLEPRRQRQTDLPATDETTEAEPQVAELEAAVEQPVPETPTEAAPVVSALTEPAAETEPVAEQVTYCEVIEDEMPAVLARQAELEAQVKAREALIHPETAALETTESAVTDAPSSQEAPNAPATTEATPAKPKKAKKEAGPKKLSALDAAAQVLQAAGKPMTTAEMIEEMSKQGLWTSPNGATPAATLYSAILREMKKGDASRFEKAERGRFGAKP